MMHPGRILLYIVFLFAVAELNAQGMPFKNFSIQNGLSQSVVTDIFQDSGGYIWISTEYGLNRFNRFEFKNYYQTDGLSHNNVLSIHEDSEGRILVGTERGLDYLAENGRFTTLPGTEILRGIPVNIMFTDSRGALWVGTDGAGIFRFMDDAFIVINTNDNLIDNIVRNIIEVPGGELYVSTRGGVSVINDNCVIRNFTTADGLTENRTRDVYRHIDGTIWVATRNGINIIDGERITSMNINDGIVHSRVTGLTFDGIEGVWIATEGGVSHFRNGNFYNYTDNNGLANNIVNKVIRDMEDNLWFGTYGGGVDLLTGEKFTHYTVQQGLLSNMITSFAEDDLGRIYTGTYGGGIALISNGLVEPMTTTQGLIDNRVYTMTTFKDGAIWVGTRNGISQLKNGRLSSDRRYNNLPDPKVRTIVEDVEGNIWIGTYGGGIAEFRNGVLHKVWNTESGLIDNIVMKILQRNDGSIWAATYGGVSVIKNGEVNTFTIDDGLVHNSVITLFEDSRNRLWVGTFGGISIIENDEISNITLDDGLPNAVIYFLEEDDRGMIWAGTNSGLVRIDPEIEDNVYSPASGRDALRFKQYTSESGLLSDEMNSNALLKDKNGDFWIGSVGGVNYFQWQLDREVKQGPPMHIEYIQVFDGVRLPGDRLVFQHDQNFIGFDFVGLSYRAPSQIIYEYRIRGIDQTWQKTTQRSVRYTTLPDGEHTFEVRARNSDGFWSESRASVSFIISPPYWKTWWFLVIVTALVGLVIGFVFNYYRIAKMVDLERIRIRIASDLHDDVGASLTEIALQADFLHATQSDPKLSDSLRQMGEMSRQIVTTMDDIVWSIDARNDKLGDLTDRMQDYANNVLLPKNIDFSITINGINGAEETSLEIRQNLYLIFKEAINNAAKHSDATQIHVSFLKKNDEYTLKIEDNGKGLPENVRPGSHGLKNMKLRADRIKATIEFVNKNGLQITIKGKGL